MERVAETAKQPEPSPVMAGHARAASPAAASLPPALELQQLAGNQAMQELLRSGFLQAKLAISNPDDPEEHEADQVANSIMRKHAGAPCSCSAGEEMCEECQQKHSAPAIQRRASGPAAPAYAPRIVSDVLRSPGHPLDAATRAFFEPRFGRDFSDIRVHTGHEAAAAARSINAHAYTAGSDIVFALGQYSPDSTPGRSLLAHELTHAIQQEKPRGNPLLVQRSWIGDRTGWVRTATHMDNWASPEPPGAYYVLNGLSMDDMISILRALSPDDRRKLASNLDEHGGGFDRSRIQLALANAAAPAASKSFREASENLLWAIRSGNFGHPGDGAFFLIAASAGTDRNQLLSALNRDALDELIAHRDEASVVPDGAGVVTAINRARGQIRETTNEQHLLDLIDGRAWKTFFTEFNVMNETDQVRFLRGNSMPGAQIMQNLRYAEGIADLDRIRYLIERTSTLASQSLYVDAFADQYSWQPKYRANQGEFSRIIRFGHQFDVELDINSISDGEIGDAQADQQFSEAKPGPGGLLWPAISNRSTHPVLWQAKQKVHEEMEELLFDDVLLAGILVIEFLMNVVFPIAHAGAIRSLKALARSSIRGRWLGGASKAAASLEKPSAPPGYKGSQAQFGNEIGWPKQHTGTPEVPAEQADIANIRQYGGDAVWARNQAGIYRKIATQLSQKGLKNPTALRRAEWLEKVAERLENEPPSNISRRASTPPTPAQVPTIVSDVIRSPGYPLDASTRAFFEPRFGRDLGDVRVHTDSHAAASARFINAHAYTAGSDIVFASGKFSPDTSSGRALLAHELTHVLLQKPRENHVLHRDPDQAPRTVSQTFPTPQELFEQYHLREEYREDRDTTGLGKKLIAIILADAEHYDLVRGVLWMMEIGDRKTVVAIIVDGLGYSRLDQIARTEDGRFLVRVFRDSFWKGMSSRDEVADRLAIDDSLGRARGRNRAEALLDAADKRAEAQTKLPAAFVDPAETNDRLRLVQAVLSRMQTQYRQDPDVLQAILSFQVALDGRLKGPVTEFTDFEEDAKLLGTSQLIAERCNRTLARFDIAVASLQKHEDIPLKVHLVALTSRVRNSWIAALASGASSTAMDGLAKAEAESAALDDAIAELALSAVEAIESPFKDLNDSVALMSAWAGLVRARKAGLSAEIAQSAEARASGQPEISGRQEHILAMTELIEISVVGIRTWEQAVRLHLELYAGISNIGAVLPHVDRAYESAKHITERCNKIRVAVYSAQDLTGDPLQTSLKNLRELRVNLLEDPKVQEFLRAKPVFIAGANVIQQIIGEIAINLGIFKIASKVSALIGRLISSGEGASALNVLAQIVGEATAFTLTTRTLGTAVGSPPESSLLFDLAMNAGLFGVMRLSGSMIQNAMIARGAEEFAGSLTQVSSFSILQGYGVLRFRLEQHHWPSSQEVRGMFADNLIMYVAMIRKDPVVRERATDDRLALLERLDAKYGDRLESFETARKKLIARFFEQLESPGANNPDTVRSLRSDAESSNKELQKILDDVRQDGEIDLEEVRHLLADPVLQSPEVSSRLVAASFDLPPIAEIRFEGGEGQFTYAFGATGDLVKSLEAKGDTVSQETAADGLHVVVAEPPGESPAFLVERPAVPAQAEPPVPKRAPQRRFVPSPPPAQPKRSAKPRTPWVPKGELTDKNGRLTSQGESFVRTVARGLREFQGRALSSDELNQALKNPKVLERFVVEHFERSINRGEISGSFISGKNRTVSQFLREILPSDPKPVEGESVNDFVNEDADLKKDLIARLRNLREALNVPADSLQDDEIAANPWRAAEHLRQTSSSGPELDSARRTAAAFVNQLSYVCGNLQPDGIIWDASTRTLTVIDATHTFDTVFGIFHEFKTLLYSRIFVKATGFSVKAIEFRSAREQRTLSLQE
jgi:hypothetical protein